MEIKVDFRSINFVHIKEHHLYSFKINFEIMSRIKGIQGINLILFKTCVIYVYMYCIILNCNLYPSPYNNE